MDIIVLAEDFYPTESGGAITDWKFAVYAVEQGHTVTVLTQPVAGASRTEVVEGVEIRRIGPAADASGHDQTMLGFARRILYTARLSASAARHALKRSPDVIYSTNYVFHPVASVLGSVRRIPVVNYIAYSPVNNSSSEPWYKLLFESLVMRVFLGSTVLVRTPNVKDKVRRLNSAHVELVEGILSRREIESIREQPPLETDSTKTTVAFLGRLSAEKNPEAAIDVMTDLGDGYQTLLMGDGPMRNDIQELVDGSTVELLGHVPHENALRVLKGTDVLILPSHTEAYPTVAFEALALGCWVVATPVGVLPDVDHPRLLIRDVEEFAATIASLGARGEQTIDERVLERHSFETYSRETLRALTEATS